MTGIQHLEELSIYVYFLCSIKLFSDTTYYDILLCRSYIKRTLNNMISAQHLSSYQQVKRQYYS